MGWSIRKSIKLGPTRLNLSSRGLGYSLGMRGLRVGTTARGGSYLRAGRGMLRYQTSLGGGRPSPVVANIAASPRATSSRFVSCLPLIGILLVVGLFILMGAMGLAVVAGKDKSAARIAFILFAVGLGFLVWAIARTQRRAKLRRESVAAYLEAANALISNPNPAEGNATNVLALRAAALNPIPENATTDFTIAYGREVAAAVADQVVTSAERQRLAIIARGLELSSESVSHANLNGFMQGVSTLLADHRLTAHEEEQLTDLREAFGVPDSIVHVQLAMVDQLRRARETSECALVPIQAEVKLRKGEECYHATQVTEKKSRVARTYVEDGVRHTERELEPARVGTLFVTNQRLLLVADGTTSIKAAAMLVAEMDIQPDGAAIVALTVDGRKTPYYSAVLEPYITLAYIERVIAQA